MRLDFTRSSHGWQEKPGNWDKLNLKAIYSSTNEWGIPDISEKSLIREEPARLVGYTDRYRTDNPEKGDCVHFFLDDYRFETMWTQPLRAVTRVARVGAALTPDFSLWPDMPIAAQIWQVYRSRWCGAWMAANGIQIIPTVTWSDERSYPFCFASLPTGATVAISTVGVTGHDRPGFDQGLEAMMRRIRPARVVVYGTKWKIDADADIVYYPTRWAERKRATRAAPLPH